MAEACLVAPVVEQAPVAVGGSQQRALVGVVRPPHHAGPQNEQRRARDDADRIELQAAEAGNDLVNGRSAGRGQGEALSVQRQPARLIDRKRGNHGAVTNT